MKDVLIAQGRMKLIAFHVIIQKVFILKKMIILINVTQKMILVMGILLI